MNHQFDIEKAKVAFANFDKDGDGLISIEGKLHVIDTIQFDL